MAFFMPIPNGDMVLQTARVRNTLLGGLPEQSFCAIAPHLEAVWLERRQVMQDYGTPVEHVFFPESLVASFVEVMSDGSAVEAATVGREGMVGVELFFGASSMATQTFCQVPGEALRMNASEFSHQLNADPRLRALVGRYALSLLQQVARGSACNSRHGVLARCARWLLQTSDRTGSHSFELSQEFLAQMLGVRRVSVTHAARELQRRGCIEYRYGVIEVLDRSALEAVSCECYHVIRREHERVLHDGGLSAPAALGSVQTSSGGLSTLRAPEDMKVSDASIALDVRDTHQPQQRSD